MWSPLMQYLTFRTMTYYDVTGVCKSEFDYLVNCSYSESYIDWPHI